MRNQMCYMIEISGKLRRVKVKTLFVCFVFLNLFLMSVPSTWYALISISLAVYLIFVLQVIITPWLKKRWTGVMLCNTADIILLTWSASVIKLKTEKWLKRGITKAFGLDSCMMNGSGQTTAALHTENGPGQGDC